MLYGGVGILIEPPCRIAQSTSPVIILWTTSIGSEKSPLLCGN